MTNNLRNLVPDSLWSVLRSAWYGMRRAKYMRYYPAGLAFDWFHHDYRTEGMTFAIPRDLTTRIHRARFFYDTHELDERILVKQHIAREATVLELGACLGIVSGVINRMLADPTRQVVVEANPMLIPTLEENKRRNNCQYQIESGLVSETSDGTFYIDDCLVVSGPVQQSDRKIIVPVLSIYGLEEKHGFKFDTVFMDIQGGEYALLNEYQPFFARVGMVILEMHPHLIGQKRVDECTAMLEKCGLRQVDARGLVQIWKRGQ